MAIIFDYEATIRQVEKLEELAERLRRIADNDLEEVLSEINQGWQGENATKFLKKGDRMKGRVLTSSGDLKNIARTIRRMAYNLRQSEQEAARLRAAQGGPGDRREIKDIPNEPGTPRRSCRVTKGAKHISLCADVCSRIRVHTRRPIHGGNL